MNYGQMTQEEHEIELRNARHQWDRERPEEAERANREHDRRVREWEAQMHAAGYWDCPVPHGPPPKGVSSARVRPD